MNKKKLRQEVLTERLSLSRRAHAEWSQAIVDSLTQLDLFQESQTIHCYLSIRQEVEIEPLIRMAWRAGKRIVVPVVDWNTQELRHSTMASFDVVEVGRCDLREPRKEARNFVTAESCDLIIVPGVAYDRSGNRIGYGDGYYDRFLRDVSAPKIAPLFSFQLVEKIKSKAWDVPMDILVTEQEVIRVSFESRVTGSESNVKKS